MKCPICKSLLREQTANARRVVNGRKIIFKDVPALVCENLNCGQIIFDSTVIEQLEKAKPLLQDTDFERGIVSFEDIKERAKLQMI